MNKDKHITESERLVLNKAIIRNHMDFDRGFVIGYMQQLKDPTSISVDPPKGLNTYEMGVDEGRRFVWGKTTGRLVTKENTMLGLKKQGKIRDELPDRLNLRLMENKSDFDMGFTQGYATQLVMPEIGIQEAQFYKDSKDPYRFGFVKGSDYALLTHNNINNLSRSKPFSSIKKSFDAKELDAKGLEYRDKLFDKVLESEYKPDYFKGVEVGYNQMGDYREEKSFLLSNDGDNVLLENIRNGAIPMNDRGSIDGNKIYLNEQKQLSVRFQEKLEQYRSIQRPSDKQAKEKDHDRGMDI